MKSGDQEKKDLKGEIVLGENLRTSGLRRGRKFGRKKAKIDKKGPSTSQSLSASQQFVLSTDCW
jgi:hypothetical protein